jgi:hypothetical protein
VPDLNPLAAVGGGDRLPFLAVVYFTAHSPHPLPSLLVAVTPLDNDATVVPMEITYMDKEDEY